MKFLGTGWALLAILSLIMFDPYAVFSVRFADHPNSLLIDELAETKNSKVLLISSWDDVYSLERNHYWRSEINADYVESKHSEVLNAASLGDEQFNEYLKKNQITHVLVPKTTDIAGIIFHKWGIRGSININLNSRYFSKVAESSGPFSSSLYKVNFQERSSLEIQNYDYQLTWANVDWWFFKSGKSTKEIGMYSIDYSIGYDGGPNASWFYDLSPDRSNVLKLTYESKSEQLQKVIIRVGLVAAYGENAPRHEIQVMTPNETKNLILSSNGPEFFETSLSSTQSISVQNVTPCRLPREFEPNDESDFKICFGVSTVEIIPQTPLK